MIFTLKKKIGGGTTLTFKVDRVAARHSSVTQLALMLLAWYPHCHWWASGARQGQPRGCGVAWAPAGKVEFPQIMCEQQTT